MRSIFRGLLELRLLITKAIFYPYFMYLDLKNNSILRRHGDVLSTRQLQDRADGTFCVFHLYPVNGLSASVRRALETLHGLGVNTVAVSNLPPSPDDEAFLEKVAHTIIVRRNIGRDFGGYKTGVLHVLKQLRPDRLVLANDSVFFMSKGLRQFFEELCGPHGYAGAAENHEFGYHVGSYALSFGSKVLTDPRFLQFWEDYRCSELRPRVIKNGEIALNRMVIRKIGVAPHVIFSLTRLASALSAAKTEELMVSASLMPHHFPYRQPLGLLHDRAATWFDISAAPRAATGFSKSLNAAAAVAEMQPDQILKLLSAGYRTQIEQTMLDFVFRGSQIHWGALLFVKHLDCPIIKTDLVLRAVYGIGDLRAFEAEMTKEEYGAFFAASTKRGDPGRHWTLAQRMMLSVGYI